MNDLEIFIAGTVLVDSVSYEEIELTEHFPNQFNEGETNIRLPFLKCYGGKGANVAVQCAMLGLHTFICGQVDSINSTENIFPHIININKFVLETFNSSTGVVSECINANVNGANTLVISKTTNRVLNVEDVMSTEPQIINSIILICHNEIPIKVTLEAIKIASRSKTLVIFNPTPAKPLNEIRDLITIADIICLNQNELNTITDCSAISLNEVIKTGRSLLTDAYCLNNILIVILNDNGAVIIRKVGEPESLHVPIREEYFKDTTAAIIGMYVILCLCVGYYIISI